MIQPPIGEAVDSQTNQVHNWESRDVIGGPRPNSAEIRGSQRTGYTRPGPSLIATRDSVLFPPRNSEKAQLRTIQAHKKNSERSSLSASVNYRTNNFKMMIQRSIHYDLSRYEEQQERGQQPLHVTTPLSLEVQRRSNNIAIKKNRQQMNSHHTAGSSDKMYDWATWRMYHRITSARKARAAVVPLDSTQDSCCIQESQVADKSELPRDTEGTPTPTEETDSLPSVDDSMVGEIFELDF